MPGVSHGSAEACGGQFAGEFTVPHARHEGKVSQSVPPGLPSGREDLRDFLRGPDLDLFLLVLEELHPVSDIHDEQALLHRVIQDIAQQGLRAVRGVTTGITQYHQIALASPSGFSLLALIKGKTKGTERERKGQDITHNRLVTGLSPVRFAVSEREV